MSTSSSSSSLRRSGRISSVPSRYDEEQLSSRLQREEERELQRALQESLELDDEESTDEDVPSEDEDGDTNEEEKQPAVAQTDGGWSTAPAPIIPPLFTTPSGLAHLLRSTQSPLDFFQLFLSDSLMDYVVKCTNEYAIFKGSTEWTPTDVSELYSFLAALIFMGIDHLPRLHL